MSNQLPVYIQIHDQIKSEIEQGIWKIGDRLPSERELAVKFNVSRMTLRQAIQNLADEGILERKIGSGTYVAREKVQEKMSGATSFTYHFVENFHISSSAANTLNQTALDIELPTPWLTYLLIGVGIILICLILYLLLKDKFKGGEEKENNSVVTK